MNKLEQEQKIDLVKIASQVRKWAYTPYSNYQVGAAVLTESGRIYDGVNIENAAFPVTVCAERTAIFKAVSNGERKFQAIAIVTKDGGMPCGSCRQALLESENRFKKPIRILMYGKNRIHIASSAKDLLPLSFDASFLK